MEEQIRGALKRAAKDIAGDGTVAVEITYPDLSFGDFATNVALKLAAKRGGKPKTLAEKIASRVKADLGDALAGVEVAGPGFINLRLSDKAIFKEISTSADRPLTKKRVVAEFSDPNPFKVLHAGHLYTSVVGDAIARLLEASGASVYRVNYGGDVGLHVAKNIWAMVKTLGGEKPEALDSVEPAKRSQWMSENYVNGNAAYEQDPAAKDEIIALNKRIYSLAERGESESPLARIYWTTRGWSYEDMRQFYARLKITFDRYYPESEAVSLGLSAVREQLARGVFNESDGAVIFRGEDYGLHTRVFISSQGLPTYEAKEIGLAELKERDYNPDLSLVISGNEQKQYMQVVYKALEQFAPEIVAKTRHVPHGIVRLSGGRKMSSREGSVVEAQAVLDVAAAAAERLSGSADERVVTAAVKYAFLKQAIGGDIIYDPDESVSLTGNSGPYLQYAHARARSILAKTAPKDGSEQTLGPGERSLAIALSRYHAELAKAATTLSPHILANYLYELSQVFNVFYENNRVLGSDREALRLSLTVIYADRLKDGLALLGIEAPDRL